MTDQDLSRRSTSPAGGDPSRFLWAATLPLDGEPAPGREARTFCRIQLQSDGLDEVADAVEAIASELVRDAVERGATPCRLRLEIGADDILVTLQDRGQPTSEQPSGLMSREVADVAAAYLAPDGWGWRELGDGRELWCRLERTRA